MFRFLKNLSLTAVVIISLASSTITFGLWAISLSTQVATMTASAAATAVAHRTALAKAVAKTKAKARLRRLIAAAPFVGLAAVGYFEEQDFQEWLLDNPEGTRAEYGCEVAALTAEVLDETLQDLPDSFRPNADQFSNLIETRSNCSNAPETQM